MRYFFKLYLTLFVFGIGIIGCNDGTGNSIIEIPIPIPTVSSDDPAIVPVSRFDQWWLDRHNDKNGIIRNQKIIFIGDSITHFWETNELYPIDGMQAWIELNEKYDNKISNIGFSGDQTQHVIWRLENGEFPVGINPEYVVIMIGTNNRHEPESIAAGIGKIVKIINVNSSSTKIILLSILPRGTGNNDENTVRNNAVNKIIRKYDGYLNIKYLDIGEYYVNSNGTLKEELFTDRLHLTLAGYNLWKEKIVEIIK
jgi:lysophospholipase L1-like esterase